jgi:LysR family nitrogen assimilation transcriptional regulator
MATFMDLRQLRYFVGIVQAGGLSRAADQLHVAQSAISHHLASLEAELDRKLVLRGPKGIVLTEAGTTLYRHAEAILRHIEAAKRDVVTASSVPSGHVSVGFPSALSAILGYELFVRMRHAYPQILLHITDGNSSLLRERLNNGRLDLALLFTARSERGLAAEPLVLEDLFFVTSDPNPDPICLADVSRYPLIVPGPGSGIQRAVQEAFVERGLTITTIGEIDTLTTLHRAVAAGLGNTILPWSALYDGDRQISLNYRRFLDANLNRPVALCMSEVAERHPAIDAAAATLANLIRGMVESGRWQGVSLIAANGPSISPSPP